jgi:glycosyltransferase involved in cell wall biosynthesis
MSSTRHSPLDTRSSSPVPRPSILDPRPSSPVAGPSTLDPRHSSFPLVTIAIPTYNRAESYLPQALKSALNQTYPNLEIIVSDNCSTDNTKAFVTGIVDPRLRYFRHESNIGFQRNQNFCVEQAKGKYLLILHDDDLIDDDFIESCIRAVSGVTDAGIIQTGTRQINSEGNILGEVPNLAGGLPVDAFFRKWFSRQAPIHLCHTLFDTYRLREIGGFKSKHNCYEDSMAVVLLAAKYGRVDVREAKASFRIHQDQKSFATNIGEWCEDSLDLLNLMRDLAPENKDEVFREGLRFFSRNNYLRVTRSSNSPFQRLIATFQVLKYFKFRQLPSHGHFLAILKGSRLHDVLRHVKRNWKSVSSRGLG